MSVHDTNPGAHVLDGRAILDDAPEPYLVTEDAVARGMNVCRNTVRAWRLSGLITPVSLPTGAGRQRVLYDPADVRALVARFAADGRRR